MADFLDELHGIEVTKSLTVRDKLLADIELQKKAAQAQMLGEDFKTGERSFHKWFFEMTDGWYTFLKVGHTSMRIKSRNAFKAGATLEHVPAFYDGAMETIRTGALDEEIAAAVEKRKEPMKGKKGKGKKAKLEVAA
jgi:hypothetical protein